MVLRLLLVDRLQHCPLRILPKNSMNSVGVIAGFYPYSRVAVDGPLMIV